ncbi:SpoIIE family protein phosphatase [Limibacter armeniacum]|uniref:PP2C family protein-serine/threonine phosphatase n=1 Tax=Limibacter armeniacum TaxID=466084 RepID=UPI002FE5366C
MTKTISTKVLGRRIMIAVFLGLLLLTSYFTYKNYLTRINTSEQQLLSRLESIAWLAAYKLDGNLHSSVSSTFKQKDDIRETAQNGAYKHLHEQLKYIKESNHLTTAIYTLVKAGDHFEFIVTSSEDPAFRHSYKEFPEILLKDYDNGGQISKYSSENGTWISAFAPLKNSRGETVAVVEVDERFDAFMESALHLLIEEILVSLASMLVIWMVLYYFLRKLIIEDEKNKEELLSYYGIVESKNKSILNSINYAERIQRSLVTDELSLKRIFPESYLFYKSKDRVSGDFPWVYSIPGTSEVLMAAVDCTGHGVPGALLSIIGHFLLNDIVRTQKLFEPHLILETLHRNVVKALHQEDAGKMSNDGMDIALLKVDIVNRTYAFAGANRPLFVISDGKVQQLKGTRIPVGGIQYEKRKKISYELVEGVCKHGDSLHIFSDGFQDQIGEQTGRRFMTKRLQASFEQMNGKPLDQYGNALESLFEEWKGSAPQLDDVLMIGVKL